MVWSQAGFKHETLVLGRYQRLTQRFEGDIPVLDVDKWRIHALEPGYGPTGQARTPQYRQTARASGRPGFLCTGTPARRCGAIRRCQLTASRTRVRAAQAGILAPAARSGK